MTIVYAKLGGGGQTECIMGEWKIQNGKVVSGCSV